MAWLWYLTTGMSDFCERFGHRRAPRPTLCMCSSRIGTSFGPAQAITFMLSAIVSIKAWIGLGEEECCSCIPCFGVDWDI